MPLHPQQSDDPPPALLVARLVELAERHAHADAGSPRTAVVLGSVLHSLLLSGAGGSLGQQQQQQADHTGRLLYARALLPSSPASALHLVQPAALATGAPELVAVAQEACARLGRWREGAWVGEVGARRREEEERFEDGVASSFTRLTHPLASHQERKAGAHVRQGTLHQRGLAPAPAARAFEAALAEDPLCWDAFEGLCELGHPLDPDKLFPPLTAPLPSSLLRTQPSTSPSGPSSAGGSFAAVLQGSSAGPGSLSQAALLQQQQQQQTASPPPTQQQHLQHQQQQPTFPLNPSSIHNHTSRSFANLSLAHPHQQASGSAALGLGGTGAPFPSSLGASRADADAGADAAGAQGSGMPASKRPRGISGARSGGANGKGKPSLGGVAHLQHQQQGGLFTPVLGAAGAGGKEEEKVVRRSSRLSTHAAVGERRSKTLPKRRALSPPSSAASDTSFADPPHSPSSATSYPRLSRTGTPTLLSSTLSEPSLVPAPAPLAQPSPAALLAVDNWLLAVLRSLARATLLLSRYRCKEALAALDELPMEVGRGNVEVCLLMGRCWFEMVDYVKAKRAFAQARALDPYRLTSMDVFSTLLWHLHDPTALSSLAHDLLAVSREAPEPWIALGNAFSLQKEHDDALRCFRRAAACGAGGSAEGVRAYAHTLSGHEAVAMEEYDRALAFFQQAVRIDKRHFNAWYGLGTAYLRKAQLRHAEHAFRHAAALNPHNAVLLCCVGQVLERRGKRQEALEVYERAGEVDPDSLMVGFRRAKALAASGRVDLALPLLEHLARAAPGEVNLHFLLGRLRLGAGDRARAMRAFALALDLDPRMAGAIKAAQQAGAKDAGGEGERQEEGDSLMAEGA